MYLGRVAAVNGGLPVTTPAFTVNRLCGSGLQAIVSAAQAIQLGDADAAVAGGAESMSRSQYWLPGLRWGQRMRDGVAVDAMVGALTDPFDGCHMGVTAENVAAEFGISRADQDALAVESHRRAAAAAAAGYFDRADHPRRGARQEGHRRASSPTSTSGRMPPPTDLARLRPAFADDGTVTAGNASGSTTRRPPSSSPAATTPTPRPGARWAASSPTVTPAWSRGSWGSARCRRSSMVLDRAGLKVDEIDVFEVNEAFAAQALAVDPRAWPAAGADQPERQRHLARAPDRRHRRHPRRQGAVRAQADRRPVRAGHDVHRRRPGHCRDLRKGLATAPGGQA